MITLLYVCFILMMGGLIAEKAKGQSLATTDPSFQLCPSGTAQLVSLNKKRGLVMKRTIRSS